jgi:hypothetical protein
MTVNQPPTAGAADSEAQDRRDNRPGAVGLGTQVETLARVGRRQRRRGPWVGGRFE